MSELRAVANKMVEKGKGILAADEHQPAQNALKASIQNQLQKVEIFIEICCLHRKILKNI